MGTIADKLTYLNGTKQALKESINNLGGSITSETTFREYAEELDTVYSSLPKVTGENTEVILTPTLKGKLGIVEKGNSTQFTTTGKNLFTGLVKGKGIKSSNGVEETDANKSVSDYIPVNFTTNPNYYVSGLTNKLNSFVNAYNSNKQSLGRTGGNPITSLSLTSSSFTSGTPQGTGDIAYIRITQYHVSENTGTIDDVDNLKIMLNVGSSAEPYEPYTNGASPNPSYPQNIKSVTGNNNVVVNNGNILDNVWQLGKLNLTTGEIDSSTTRIVSTNYQAIKPSTTYTFGDTTYTKQVCFYKSDKTFRSGVTLQAGQTQRISPTTNDYYIRVSIVYDSTGVTPDINTKLALVEGTTEYPYIAPQTKPLNLGTIELNKIGTYQDYIYKNNDKWYKKEVIGKHLFTGEESYTLSGTSNVFYINTFSDNILYDNANIPICSNLIGTAPVGGRSFCNG